MSEITVIRGLGDRPGPDIVDALLTTDRLKVARGRAEIDEATPVVPVAISQPLTGWIERGTLFEITDIEYRQYRGMVVASELVYELSADGEFTATTDMTVERLLEE